VSTLPQGLAPTVVGGGYARCDCNKARKVGQQAMRMLTVHSVVVARATVGAVQLRDVSKDSRFQGLLMEEGDVLK
jgi:hypothetical protein